AGIQYFVKKQTDVGEKRFAVVDLTPGKKIFPWVMRAADRRNKTGIYDKQTGQQVQAVFDLVEVNPGSDEPSAIDQLRFELSERVKKEVQRQFDEALDPESAIQPLPLQMMGLSKRDPASGRIEDPPLVQVVARFLVPAGLVMLMFLVVMLGSTPAMQAIVEEKSLRIAEVLLGSVRPFDLMMGKLLGLMG